MPSDPVEIVLSSADPRSPQVFDLEPDATGRRIVPPESPPAPVVLMTAVSFPIRGRERPGRTHFPSRSLHSFIREDNSYLHFLACAVIAGAARAIERDDGVSEGMKVVLTKRWPRLARFTLLLNNAGGRATAGSVRKAVGAQLLFLIWAPLDFWSRRVASFSSFSTSREMRLIHVVVEERVHPSDKARIIPVCRQMPSAGPCGRCAGKHIPKAPKPPVMANRERRIICSNNPGTSGFSFTAASTRNPEFQIPLLIHQDLSGFLAVWSSGENKTSAQYFVSW